MTGIRSTRTTVMQELQDLLSKYGPREEWKFQTSDPVLPEHVVHVFGNNALCTMVNSEPFVNSDFSPDPKPVRGIDELTYCIMQLLSAEQVQGWCQTVLGNRSVWQKINQQAHGFARQRWSFIRELAAATVSNIESNAKSLGARFSQLLNKMIS